MKFVFFLNPNEYGPNETYQYPDRPSGSNLEYCHTKFIVEIFFLFICFYCLIVNCLKKKHTIIIFFKYKEPI